MGKGIQIGEETKWEGSLGKTTRKKVRKEGKIGKKEKELNGGAWRKRQGLECRTKEKKEYMQEKKLKGRKHEEDDMQGRRFIRTEGKRNTRRRRS
jgi:hypothetical protein